uniref:Cytokine like 1 n=1 Tax=Myotis lucifugus TaxID=59463 RepID=G1P532_MYOLU
SSSPPPRNVGVVLWAGAPERRPLSSLSSKRRPRLRNLILKRKKLMVWSLPSEELCVMYLPRLYLDIHNYCVLAKLRDFVASPHCWRVAPVDALKDKVRKLYTIMNSFCRRDLVFLSDDCSALDYPIPATTVPPDPQG